jgi:hypothetical protein
LEDCDKKETLLFDKNNKRMRKRVKNAPTNNNRIRVALNFSKNIKKLQSSSVNAREPKRKVQESMYENEKPCKNSEIFCREKSSGFTNNLDQRSVDANKNFA